MLHNENRTQNKQAYINKQAYNSARDDYKYLSSLTLLRTGKILISRGKIVILDFKYSC